MYVSATAGRSAWLTDRQSVSEGLLTVILSRFNDRRGAIHFMILLSVIGQASLTNVSRTIRYMQTV